MLSALCNPKVVDFVLSSLCQLFLISNDPGLCQMFLVITVAYLIFWGPLFLITIVTLSAISDQ